MRFETTTSVSVSLSGVGLHTGRNIHVNLHPAPERTGIVFHRTDVGAAIPALVESAGRLEYATALGEPGRDVSTVEHFLAACYGEGIDNLVVEVDGPEMPVLDGSSLPWLELLDKAGRVELSLPIVPLKVQSPLVVNGFPGKYLEIKPSDDFRVTYVIDFPHPAIGKQAITVVVTPESFRKHLAAARTFGFLSEYEYLKSKGLARGASAENCIVIGEAGVENGELRYADEFVRHKALDLIGDLALVGRPILGHVIAHRAGHRMHAELSRQLREESTATMVGQSFDGERELSGSVSVR